MNKTKTYLDSIIQNRFLSHLLFWIGYVLFNVTLLGVQTGGVFEHIVTAFSLLPIQLVATYLLVYYQVPELLLKRRYVLFVLSVLITFYFFSAVARLAIIYIAEPFFRINFEQESIAEVFSDPGYLSLVYIPVVYAVAFIFLVIKTLKTNSESRQALSNLQNEKTLTELKFLKAQINPHFLFNTLNNLYALTILKSDKAPETVLKLSEMLDYILYRCNEPLVLLQNEITLLENYISLEQLRYGDKLEVSFNKNIENSNVQIAPLILVSFVENAFKHGIRGLEENSKIIMSISEKENEFEFNVSNTKPQTSVQKNNKKENIGAKNVARQLELNYPKRHSLDVLENEDAYSVQLKIKLN